MFIISKIISNGENNYTQSKYNKLQKISAKNLCFFPSKNKCKSARSSLVYTVQLHGVDLIDIQIQN